MNKKRIADWARDMCNMLEGLPRNAHSDRVDFEIDKILQKHGIDNPSKERVW